MEQDQFVWQTLGKDYIQQWTSFGCHDDDDDDDLEQLLHRRSDSNLLCPVFYLRLTQIKCQGKCQNGTQLCRKQPLIIDLERISVCK